jgi:hypothetical protein
MRFLAFAAVICSVRVAAADYVNGAPDFVREAEAVLLVKPNGNVAEVIAGVWFESKVAGTFGAHGAIVLVQPRTLRNHPELAVEAPPPRDAPIVWLLDAKAMLPPEVPREGGDGRLVRSQGGGALSLLELRAIVKQVRPLDVGLASRLRTPKQTDATAIIVAAIYDVGRTRRSPAKRTYPPLPSPLVAPAVQTPDALLKLIDGDPAKFATEMRAWLDRGIVRDRDLRGMTTTDRTKWPGADFGEFTYSDVRFPPLAAIFDAKSPSKDRLAALAAYVMHAHAERFAEERALAAKELASEAPCSERVKAAAYWELVDNYIKGPAHAAFARLAECTDAKANALIELAHRLRPDAPVLGAVEARKQKAVTPAKQP